MVKLVSMKKAKSFASGLQEMMNAMQLPMSMSVVGFITETIWMFWETVIMIAFGSAIVVGISDDAHW
jgi:hypothetical protein